MQKIKTLIPGLFALTLCACFEDSFNPAVDATRQSATIDDGIRIFSHFATSGLNTDSKILRTYFSQHLNVTDQKQKSDDIAFVNIFFESVDAPYLAKAKYNWFVINQELSPPVAHLRGMDVVICKSRYAVELVKKMREQNGLTFAIVYTKFTTMPLTGPSPEPNYSKDYGLAVHAAGQSPFKGTGSLFKAWMGDQSLPKLVVSCRDYADKRIGCRYLNMQAIFTHRYMSRNPNLKIFSDEFMPKDEFEYLMSHAGLFMVTSEMEGYGHYINEGRERGAGIITTNCAPMNEMVEDGVSGILVPASSKYIYNSHSQAERCVVDPQEIRNAVKRFNNLTTAEKLKMGMQARKAFEDDTNFLRERVARLAQSLKEHGNLSGAQDILE